MTEATEYYFKDNDFMLTETGEPWKGKGRGIFRTALVAMFTRSMPMLAECKRLLLLRRRWPRRLDSTNGIEHRNPWQMTTDLYVAFYSACIEMEREHWIKEVKPPLYLIRPRFMSWRRFLITGKKKHKHRFEFWVWVTNPFQGGKSMEQIFNDSLMAWTANSYFAMKLERPRVPEWNLCVRQLVKHPDRIKDLPAIESFIPARGFIWAMESDDHRRTDPDFLPLFETYYLDWDALTYFRERNLGFIL
jgi:hypothetical protein